MAGVPVRFLLLSFVLVSACEQGEKQATMHSLRLGLGLVVLSLTFPSSKGKLKRPGIKMMAPISARK